MISEKAAFRKSWFLYYTMLLRIPKPWISNYLLWCVPKCRYGEQVFLVFVVRHNDVNIYSVTPIIIVSVWPSG